MPRFSVCINAYNAQESLKKALDSVLKQDFDDFELLVLDDASTDSTPKIIKSYEKQNECVKAFFNKQNEGLYLGRKNIVERCSGKYTLFLDADDEMGDNFLGKLDKQLVVHDVDMFHYGIKVKGVGVDKKQCDDFEAFANAPVGDLHGDEILNSIFGGRGEFVQDWQLPQRAFRTKFLKKAFKLMSDTRLDCAEDAYEMFVICALAKTQATNNDIMGLVYNYGAGLNGKSAWSKDKFLSVAKDFSKCLFSIDSFAIEFKNDILLNNAKSARKKLLELLFSDWHERVSESEKQKVANACLEFMDRQEVASQIARCVRDDTYQALLEGKSIEDCKHLRLLFNYCEGLARECDDVLFYEDYAKVARSHFSDLEARKKTSELSKRKDLRIFVSCHKEALLFDSEILQPVQVGAVSAPWRFPWAFQDDRGENISELNPMYCELTAQYWAWKNVDCDIYGFCHYRRYFNFSQEEFSENEFGEIMDGKIDDNSQVRYGLIDKNILNQVKDFDIVTTKFQDLTKFPGDFKTPREHWNDAKHLKIEDLDLMVEILDEMYPDYSQACSNYLNGNRTCFCNMFVMKKEIFNDYCEWLFSILEEFCKRRDFKNYSKEALRTAGHLGERLLNIYIIKHEMQGANWKRKEVQCVHFEKPEKFNIPNPSYSDSEFGKETVPVVFAADDNYVPVLTTAIYSCVKNASSDYRYDFCVLNQNITWENQVAIKSFIEAFSNASVRFIDVRPLIEDFDLKTSNEHISIETYYRFLIPEILGEYERVVYLDADMIIEGDVSKLFNVEIGNNLIAAVPDLDFLGNLNFANGERLSYNKKTLKMKDPYNYFQAGVLVFNMQEIKKLHSTRQWLEFAQNEKLIYNDQDILNRECEGRVFYLPFEWNVMHNCAYRIAEVFTFAPAKTYSAYLQSRENPQVIHYAGFEKPWSYSNVDLEQYFWQYAIDTPFYQRLLREGAGAWQATEQLRKRFDRHQKLYHPALNIAAKAYRKIKEKRG